MAKGWQTVELRQVMKLDLTKVPLDAGTDYPMVGVYSFGRGLFLREPVSGNNTSYKFFYRLKAEHVVMSQLFGWEGALALSSGKFAGLYVSPQFPTFLCDTEKLDHTFLGWLMRQKRFWDDLGKRTKGMGDRRRTLNPEALLSMEIPLPPLMEQRRIVERIEALARRVAEAQSLRREASEEANYLVHSVKSQIFSADGSTTVKDFADIQSGYAFKSEWFSPEGIRLVRNVNIGHGDIRWDEIARIPLERRGEFPSFELNEGDILISLDRPLISSGLKAARVRKQDLPSLLLQRVGRVNFKNNKVLPEFLFKWLHSPNFISSIDQGRSNGVPHISQKDIERIPFSPPPLEEQRRLVAYLDGLQAQVSQLRAHQEETRKELSALMPSVLDRAFKGEL